MNYEEMSDFDITTSVASYVAEKGWLSVAKSTRSDSELILKYKNGPGCTRNEYVDYCNNPSDAWPIIDSIFWQLTSADELGVTEWARLIRKEDCSDKLRAAMIVFLMIKDAECQKS